MDRSFTFQDASANADLCWSVSYREHGPTPALSELVDRFWFFRSNGRDDQETPLQQCIPMGMVEVILMLRGRAHGFFDGRWMRFPQAYVVGVLREPVRWTMSGNGWMMGVRLRPEAAIRLFGMPLKEVSGFYTEAQELLGARWCEGLDDVAEAPDEGEAMRRMQAFLERRLARSTPGTERFLSAVHRLRTEGTAFGHRGLGDQLNVCDRQAQRLFKEHLGLSPMTYQRILRFRQVYDHATAMPVQRWSDLAYDLGYADQAHMIRDFKSFCGFTPGMLQEGKAPAFLLRGRLADHRAVTTPA